MRYNKIQHLYIIAVCFSLIHCAEKPKEDMNLLGSKSIPFDLPPHIKQITSFGQRADWSHDGERILFIEKTFGDVFEVEIKTGEIRPLTHHYYHEGYVRALYLSNGDILLSGARHFDSNDPVPSRKENAELWVLKKDLLTPPVSLGDTCYEGPAVSRHSLKIAWTVRGDKPDAAFYLANLSYQNDIPELVNKKKILTKENLPCFLDIETQNFRPPDEKEIIFSGYGDKYLNCEVMGLNIETGVVTNYSLAKNEYNEPEGIFPMGNFTLVECDRHNSGGTEQIDIYKLTLDGSGSTERITFFADYPGYKSSNPVVSDNGKFMAFQVAKAGDWAGVGRGILIFDLEAYERTKTTQKESGKRTAENETGTKSDGSTTVVSIKGEEFYINEKPTYQGRIWSGYNIQGLLFNTRQVQGIFDDLNPETSYRWVYPDTKTWDPERNTNEFVENMAEWKRYGLLGFTINLQGGSPEGYSRDQPWFNSAITEEGELRPEYMKRLEKIMDRANELRMIPILGIFYFGQDQRLKDENAVIRAVDNTINWLFDHNYHHVLIEINNECNVRYDHEILRPERVHELIERVKNTVRNGQRYLVSTSYGGNTVPKPNVVKSADFILLHGNGISDPNRIVELVNETRNVPGYRPMPILFNEDDHYNYDQPLNNFVAAISTNASWGFFDYRRNDEDYHEGFQSVPVDWSISSERKKSFFSKLKEITGY